MTKSPEPTQTDRRAAEISFGPFRLAPKRRLLQKEGLPVVLGGRAMDLLIALTERPQEILSKRELVDKVWPNLTVDDSSLRVHMSSLRKALNDHHAAPQYIVSVPGRGYSFVVPVTRVERDDTSEAPNVDRRQSDIPALRTKVIGRDEAIESVSTQLLEERFVSIVGAGGIGKTTVALAVVRELYARFQDGVQFVDLSVVEDPSLVSTTVALAIGARASSPDPTIEIVSTLNARKSLIVFDSYEHVVEATAFLAEAIFVGCPTVYLLATGRESLRVDGECVHRLQPLACPPESQDLENEEISQFPATKLFIERLSTRRRPSDAELPVIGAICRRLDGIALSIELAAGWVDAYGIDGLASLLGSEVALHLSGKRNSVPRQRSLGATIDWSYRLLSEHEQRTLRQLSVFVGTFSIDEAQAIADPEGVNHDLMELIAALVSKSWLTTLVTKVGLRFRMLDMVRTHLRRLATAHDEARDSARLHAALYQERLERRRANVSPSSEMQVGLEECLANTRAALDWTFSQKGDLRLGLGLAAAAVSLFLESSLLSECVTWAERAISKIGPEDSGGRLAGELHTCLAFARMFTEGNTETTRQAFLRALDLSESADSRAQIRLRGGFFLYHTRVGSFADAVAQAKSIFLIAEKDADPDSVASANGMLGAANHFAGNQALAQSLCEPLLNMPPTSVDPMFQWYGFDSRTCATGALSRVLWLRGRPERAIKIARQAMLLADTLDHPVTYCISMFFAVSVFFWAKDFDTAEEIITEIRKRSRTYALAPYDAVASGMHGKLLIERGDTATGLSQLRACISTLEAVRYRSWVCQFKAELAEILFANGTVDEARSMIEAATALDGQYGGSWYTPELLRIKGVILGATPTDATTAESHFARSMELAQRHSALSFELRAAVDLNRLHRRLGRPPDDLSLRALCDKFTEAHDIADLVAARELLNA